MIRLLVLAALLLPSIGWGQSYWSLTTGAGAPIWRLNGDANNDGTGDANAIVGSANGTWTGTPAYVDAPTGKGRGKSFDFNGSSRVGVGAVTGAPSGSNARTICFWWQSDAFPSDNTTGGIFGYTATSGGTGALLEAYGEDQALSAAFNGHRLITPKTTLSTATWYHGAIVIPSGATTTGQSLLYLGGVLQTTSSEAGSSQTLNTVTPSIMVGSTYDGSRNLDGRVYDARIYNAALSAGQIAEIVAGPEPTVTSGATIDEGGETVAPVFDYYSNGSALSVQWQYYDPVEEDWFSIGGWTNPAEGPAERGVVTGSYRLAYEPSNNGGPGAVHYSNELDWVAATAFSRIGSPRIGSPRVIPLNQ